MVALNRKHQPTKPGEHRSANRNGLLCVTYLPFSNAAMQTTAARLSHPCFQANRHPLPKYEVVQGPAAGSSKSSSRKNTGHNSPFRPVVRCHCHGIHGLKAPKTSTGGYRRVVASRPLAAGKSPGGRTPERRDPTRGGCIEKKMTK